MPVNQQQRVKYAIGKIQAALGTAETLTSAEVLRTMNAQTQAYDGNDQVMQFDGPSGVDETYRTRAHSTLSGSFELAGSGTGTPDANPNKMVDLFFRAAGYNAVDVATTSRTYTIDRTDYDTHEVATMQLERPNDLLTIQDLKMIGSLGLTDGIPTISFTGKGDDQPMADNTGAIITPGTLPTYVDQARGLSLNDTNTPTLSLHGIDVCVTDISLDNFGFDLVFDDNLNCEYVQLNSVNQTGTITIKAPDIATSDFYALARTEGSVTTGAFNWVHGTAVTNRFTASSTAVQILPGIDNTGATSGGFQTLTMRLNFIDPLAWEFS